MSMVDELVLYEHRLGLPLLLSIRGEGRNTLRPVCCCVTLGSKRLPSDRRWGPVRIGGEWSVQRSRTAGRRSASCSDMFRLCLLRPGLSHSRWGQEL